MKSTIISMMIVLILMVVLPMIFLGDGDIASKFKLPDFGTSSRSAKLPSNIKTVTTDTTIQLYKWRDENGVMEFSNLPPEHGEAEQIELTPNLSTMQPVKIPVQEVTATNAAPVAELGNPYSPSGMKHMVEQANALKEMLNQQQADQQKALENINQR